LFILLFSLKCCHNNATDICRDKYNFIEKLKTIDSLLYNCCDCELAEKAVDCPSRELVLQVCNSNMAMDDNFDVFLNGQLIGQLDLAVNDNVGSIFIASMNSGLVITEPDFTCPISKMKVYRFNPKIVHFGENILEMRNTRNNGNNNEGSIDIRNYLRQGVKLVAPCKVTDLAYNMNSGSDYTVTFNYTRCCE